MKTLILLLLTFSAKAVVPDIKKGEVKIIYPCEILEMLPKGQKEKVQITFYEQGKNDLFRKGLVVRKRSEKSNNDLTIKFRSHQSLEVNERIYMDLDRSEAGKLKCEADVTYDVREPSIVYSCSFKGPTKKLIKEHYDFLKMVGLSFVELDENLRDLREVKVDASEWRYQLNDLGPFSKAPSIERWIFKDKCLLEVSAEFKTGENLKANAAAGLKYLKDLIPASPSRKQGGKTEQILDK